MTYRKRFGLKGPPLPKSAQGATFFRDTRGFRRIQRAFDMLLEEPGLGVFTGEAGVGKTAAIRELCASLPAPDFRVIYLCNTAGSPQDVYRTLAVELGIKPPHRRYQLWCEIKRTLLHLVDERATQPVIIIDEAQHLSDQFLSEFSGFLNFEFDSRELVILWLVGLPSLLRHLRMRMFAPLNMRVAAQVALEPLGRQEFAQLIDHALRAVGATTKLLSDPCQELLFRHSRGLPRLAAKLLRTALREAHARDQGFIDEHVLEAAIEQLALTQAGAA